MIDATVHQIRRPAGPRQAEFYRGDKKFHFPGHLNDAQTYRMIPQPGMRPFSLPGRARLAADGGYPAGLPLITPRRIGYSRRQRRANRVLRSVRVRIEHSIGFQKIYNCISSKFRHQRPFLPYVVMTCGFLSNRRKHFIKSLA